METAAMQSANNPTPGSDAAARGQWSSKLGFILAAAGSAIGLGNIWRFPYMTGENGGAAFVVVYLACVFLVGVPLMFNELALGRASGRNPIGAFTATMPGTPFVVTGVLCLLCCFLVLSYYSVIAGWTIGYAWNSLAHKSVAFERFAADPGTVLPLFALFLLLTILIVQGGVQKGIERWSKVLMPLLLLMCLVVILRSVTLPGAGAGIEYYLKPDFSKINMRVVMAALGQAFFSLSVGWGLMITYGSYMSKRENIVQCGFWVAMADTAVALLGGFMVFPAVFAFGKAPDAGTALTFKTLPEVFAQMPAGGIVGCVFFLLLTVAALTSSISMLEVPVSYFIDSGKARRKVAAWAVGGLAFLIGIPSALSTGANEWLTHGITFAGKTGFLDVMDYIAGTVVIALIALLCSLYVGWVWKTPNAIKEIEQGAPGFTRPLLGGISQAKVWAVFVQIICPAIVLVVLLNMLGLHLF